VISTSILNRIAKSRTIRSTPRPLAGVSTEGFTLVEVMIAIVLLVMISVAIYQATTQTFRYRAKIIHEGDFYGAIRLSMGLVDRDISALFSPVNLNPKNFGDTASTSTAPDPDDPEAGFPTRGRRGTPSVDPQAAAAQTQQLADLRNSELGKVSDFWLGATDLTGIRPSRFVGTEDRISFVTASHMRIYKNAQESEFSKVVYELREDKDSDLGDGYKVLVKIEDPNVFDDTEKTKDQTAKIYPLLPGVKAFKFSYYRRDKKAWENTWDTNRDDMKGLYPDIIKLTLEVDGLSRLSFRGVYMFKPETPFYGMDPTL
jgi:prepilin-type N-terminal cleavage/methylation domain-containing protein